MYGPGALKSCIGIHFVSSDAEAGDYGFPRAEMLGATYLQDNTSVEVNENLNCGRSDLETINFVSISGAMWHASFRNLVVHYTLLFR